MLVSTEPMCDRTGHANEAVCGLLVQQSEYRLDVFHDHVGHGRLLFDDRKQAWMRGRCRTWLALLLIIILRQGRRRWRRRRRCWTGVTSTRRCGRRRLTSRRCWLFRVFRKRQNLCRCFRATVRSGQYLRRRSITVLTAGALSLCRRFSYNKTRKLSRCWDGAKCDGSKFTYILLKNLTGNRSKYAPGSSTSVQLVNKRDPTSTSAELGRWGSSCMQVAKTLT